VLAFGRVAADGRFDRYLPSLPNLVWGALVAAVLALAARPRKTAAAWRELAPELRDLAAFGGAPAALWLLDPASMRGLGNQFLLTPPPAPAAPLAQTRALGSLLAQDYVSGAALLALFAAGLVSALFAKGTLRAMAAHAVWPVALMPLSPYPIEARFFGSLVPLAIAAAVCGLAALLDGVRSAPVRRAAWSAAALALAAGSWRADARFAADVAGRATYRYRYSQDEIRFLREMEAASDGTRPIAVALPDFARLAPTLRLEYRLRFPRLPEGDVFVDVSTPEETAEMLRVVARAPRAETEVFVPGEASPDPRSLPAPLSAVSVSEGPALPGAPAMRMWRVVVRRG
jgi:hypothetical protein